MHFFVGHESGGELMGFSVNPRLQCVWGLSLDCRVPEESGGCVWA